MDIFFVYDIFRSNYFIHCVPRVWQQIVHSTRWPHVLTHWVLNFFWRAKSDETSRPLFRKVFFFNIFVDFFWTSKLNFSRKIAKIASCAYVAGTKKTQTIRKLFCPWNMELKLNGTERIFFYFFRFFWKISKKNDEILDLWRNLLRRNHAKWKNRTIR